MFSFTQLLFALFLFICYEYYLQNKKNLVLLWAPHSEEKQRLKMTHLFFYLELKTKTQGHITNNIYHYKMKVVFVNQDNRVNVGSNCKSAYISGNIFDVQLLSMFLFHKYSR